MASELDRGNHETEKALFKPHENSATQKLAVRPGVSNLFGPRAKCANFKLVAGRCTLFGQQ